MSSVADAIVTGARSESDVWAGSLRSEPDWTPVFSPLAPERFALGLETVYEAYLVHYGHARLFDARSDVVDERAFAERCEEDRHHFRFIVSPEDAADMTDLRAFARELMADAERDLTTRLDWVAVDHWNTDNPHVHLLIRGRADDGQDLVISRDYISRGIRDRAAERITLELGPRTEQQIQSALEREVEAERWTSLDRALRDIEKRVHAADTKLAAKAEEAARSLDEARQSALAEIEGLAAEAAREIVGKLTGAAVDAKTARKAVAGALSRA